MIHLLPIIESDTPFYKLLLKHWGLNLLVSAGVSICAAAYYFNNRHDVYILERLNFAALLLLPAFIILSFLNNLWLIPNWKKFTRAHRSQILLAAAAFFCLIVWLQPLPMPAVPVPHQIILSATGQSQEGASSTQVEIRELNYLNGLPVPEDHISRSEDWQVSDGVYYSLGAPDSRLEISGSMPLGVVAKLRFYEQGGFAVLNVDGDMQQVDTYSSDGTTLPFELGKPAWFALPFSSAVIVLVLVLLAALGLVFTLWGGLTLLYTILGERASTTVVALLALAVFGSFLFLKASYLRVDGVRTFRDSLSYARTAEAPLTSAEFWAGERSFSVPLMLKLLDMNSGNFESLGKLETLSRFHLALSALSWTALAAAAALSVRSRWLSLLLFGGILAFSLTPEIGIWDSLLLSESLAFSSFALLLASWIGLARLLPTLRSAWLRGALLLASAAVTIVYSFVRDSNVYFVLAGAALLLLGSFLHPHLRRARRGLIIYTTVALAVLAAQNISMSAGNRWQVFIYDHLAMRILRDPAATEYFAEQGLPLSDSLMETTEMVGHVYQPILMYESEMQPVRDWVNCCGKQTYVRYLLSDPLNTFWEPLARAGNLLNGSNLEYRNPRYQVTPLPGRITALDRFFFNRQPWMTLLLLLAGLAGAFFGLRRGENPLWLLIAILVLSLYPLMGLIWHGEPMEIERHAAQVILQFRLAGWIALALLCGMLVQTILPDTSAERKE